MLLLLRSISPLHFRSDEKHLNNSLRYLAFASPVVATSWLVAPVGIIQGIYAKYYGLSLTTIAGVIMLSRVFDALTDPLIGYYADRFYQRTHSYRPFIMVGGILFIVSSYFLYIPPIDVTAFYFLSWYMILFFAWTLIEMPHVAWAGKIARTSAEKTKIYSFRSMCTFLGLLLFYAIPFLPIFNSPAFTPDTLEVSVTAAIFLMPVFLIMCLGLKFSSKQKSPILSGNVARGEMEKNQRRRQLLLSVFKNKPLLIFIGAYGFISISSGLWFSLIFLFVDVYLDLGDQFAKMFLVAYVVGILSIQFWYKLAIRLGKKLTWAIGNLLLILSYVYTGFLSPEDVTFAELAAIKIFQTLGFTCTVSIAPAMLSEIVDFSNWRYRTDENATYFAIHAFVHKTAAALATSIGLGLAGLYGFQATTVEQTDSAVFGITLIISWLPAGIALLALSCVLLSPINDLRHAIIRRRLDALAVRHKISSD